MAGGATWGRDGIAIGVLHPDLVRWSSATLLAVFAAVFLGDAFLGTGRRRESLGTIRTSRPSTFVTGRLSDILQACAAVILLLEVIVPDWVYGGGLTIALPGDSILQVVGGAAWFLALGLTVWAVRNLGAYGWGPTAVYRDHRLITSGPYRWIRHPLYAALLLMNGGAALFLLNPVLGALFVATYAVTRRMALAEENLLSSEEGLGDAYRVYMRHSGRLLPRWRSKG